MTKYIFFGLITFLVFLLPAQDKKADSLRYSFSIEKSDTAKAKTAYRLAAFYLNKGVVDSGYAYALKSLKLSEKSNFTKGLAASNQYMGQAYNYKRMSDSAIYHFERSKKYFEQLKDSSRVAGMLNNIGIAYRNCGNLRKALEYYFLSLKAKEQIHDSSGMANAMHNIGQIYNQSNDSVNSLKYFNKALEIRRKIHDESGIGYSLVTIGLHYKHHREFIKAKECLFEALKIAEETSEDESIAIASYNIGSIYYDEEKIDASEVFFKRALAISRKNSDLTGIALCLESLAYLEIARNNHSAAIPLLEEAYAIAKTELDEIIGGITEKLSEVYESTGNYKKALFYHKISKTIADSLFNAENVRKFTEESLKYEQEKEKLLIQKEQEKKETELKAEAFRKNLIIGVSIFILVLVSIFSYTIYRKLNENRRQKHIIEEQQKEMIDSINYAKRIQYALLAHSGLLNKYLPEHFVLFKPKDIVSGDFYWATLKDNNFYLAVCDCTGHGVPGAFMSLLNINFLNEAIIEKNISSPGEILNHVREQLIKKLEGERDGMDAILFRFPIGKTGSYSIDFASANNSALLIRDNEIIELKKDSMPIGLGERKDSFATHTIDVKTGDCLYLYTDGFADQFGGPKGKKFKYKQLNDLILSNALNSAERQKQVLENNFETWRGNLEQVDDVCVIGICVK